MNKLAVSIIAGAVCLANPAAQTRTSKTLDIYIVDVEGGNATLFVTPEGESVLIDTGNGGPAAVRDADRIMAAVKEAGITQIDALITSHWHGDHMGAMAELAGRIPIRHYLDHGPNVQPAAAVDEFLQKTYPGLVAKAKHTVVKAGDTVPLKGVEWRIVTSGRQIITKPLPGAGQSNPYCAGFKPHTVNPVSGQPIGNTEDEHSVGSHLSVRRLSGVVPGRLPVEQRIRIDVSSQQARHTRVFARLPSWPAQLELRSAGPCTAAPCGRRSTTVFEKEGSRRRCACCIRVPGLENLWQLHVAQLSGPEYDIPGMFVANIVEDIQHSPAHWIKVSAQSNGTFTVTNNRNGFTKTYVTPRRP